MPCPYPFCLLPFYFCLIFIVTLIKLMSNFSSLHQRLRSSLKETPTQSGEPVSQAAVSLVLRQRFDETDLLVIKRALAERDHWSGHLALPGGRKDESDADLRETAVRETREEVGIEIELGGEVLGALDTIRPESRFAPKILVTPFVAVAPREYHILSSSDEAEPLRLNHEVAEA